MSARPLVGPAIGLAAGIALGLHGLPFPSIGWAAAALAAAVPPLAPVGLGAIGWHAAARSRATEVSAPGDPALLEARVASVPDRFEDRVRLRARTPEGRSIELSASETPWPLALGDRIRVRALLRIPPGARNPGGRDVRARLGASGTALQAVAIGPVVRLASPSGASWLERGRERLALAARRALPPREAALVRAIGAGDAGAIDPATTASFSRSGLAHVLSVSGLHLVVVAFGLARLVRALLLRVDALAERVDARRGAAAATLPLALVYALATGADVPVLRAAIAAAVALGGAILDREAPAANTLALAALVLLAADPGAAIDPSLQLSFSAVAGLVLWAGPLRRALPFPPPARGTWRARLVEPLVSGACASVAASVATAPVLAFHFRQLPLLGVVANVPGVPLGSALTVLASIAAVLAAIAPAAAVPLLYATRPLAAALGIVSDLAAAPRWGVIPVGSPGLGGVLASYAAAALATGLRGRARVAAWVLAAGCLFAPAHLRARAAALRGELEVLFVSVGQGDAVLLRLPDGSAVLVDGGGAPEGGPDPGARDVVPLLRDLGVRRLAAVFVSHPHPDHVLGLAAVADAFPIDVAFSNGDPGEGAAAEVIARLAPRALAPGDGWTRAGVRFDVLGGDRTALGANDASLVLRVRYGATSVLLPGDVEEAGEAAALVRGGLAAGAVKVPHHGSRRSSTAPFAAAVGAQLAIASVGAGNRYRFPHAEALQRWRATGAAILRTDEDGAILLRSDGRAIRRVPAAATLDPLAIRPGRTYR
jgi:competence protein ComEC